MALLGVSSSNTKSTPPATALRIQTSVLGIPRPIGWGQARLSGNLLWYGDFVASPVKSTNAGKGLGGGGSGKGTSGSSSYNYSAAVLIGLCEGPISGVLSVWNNKTEQALSDLNLVLLNGSYSQDPWGYLTSKHPDQALAYRGTACLAAGPMQLGTSQELPNLSFETLFAINSAIPGLPDADPADVLTDILTNPYYGIGFPESEIGDLTLWSTYCRALGLLVSPTLTSQSDAASFIGDLVKATNSELVYNGSTLTVVPYGDEVITGNGYTYTPPSQALFDFGDDDILPNSSGPSQNSGIWLTRNATNEAKNIIPVEYLDRGMDYNPDVVTATDDASRAQNGPLNAEKASYHFFCIQAAAQMCAQLLLGREQARNTGQIIVGPEYFMLDPMDINEYVDAILGADNQGIRFGEMTENDDDSFTIAIEEYGPGMGAAPVYGSQPNDGHIPNYQIAPGDTNAPAIFDVPVALAEVLGLETWIATAGGADWGGCNVWLSTDNATYGYYGKMLGPSRMGVQSADFPITGDPDTATPLSVDLTESFAALNGGTKNDADQGVTLCFVDGEYVSYQQATLTAQYNYDLGATGSTPGYLRRGLYGTAIADHPAGSLFVRLDDSVFRIPYKNTDVGSTIYVKLQSFNKWGGGIQDLSTCIAYEHTIGGPPVLYAPTNLTVTAGIKSLQLGWTNPGDIGIAAMEIWRSPNSSFGSATHIDDAPAYATSYTDLTTGSNTAYWYWIRVRDIAGNEGLWEPSNTGAGVTTTTGQAATADIGTAQVVTTHMVANAVTDPNVATASSSTIQNSGFGALTSASISTSGGVVMADFNDWFARSGGHSPQCTYKITGPNGDLNPGVQSGGSGAMVACPIGGTGLDTSVSGSPGSYTYTLYASANGGDPSCVSKGPVLRLTELKR